MCRTGERHCRLTEHQRFDHNRRRRENRRIRGQIKKFIAGRNDVPEGFSKYPIDRQKGWVADHGGGGSVLGANTAIPLPRGKNVAATAPPPARPVAAPARPKTVAGGADARAGGAGLPHRLRVGVDLIKAVNSSPDLTDDHKRQVFALHSRVDAHDDLEMALYTRPIECNLKMGARGVNAIQRLALEGGGEGYFKPFSGTEQDIARSYGDHTNQQPIHEVAAWQLARNLGTEYASIVAHCGLRQHNGEWGSMSLGAPGTAFASVRPEKVKEILATPETKKQFHDAAFLDALTGNQDRHGGNFLASNRGITLIDHGFAFSASPWVESTLLEYRVRGDAHELTDRESALLTSFLDSKDANGMEGILEPHRVEAMRKRAKAMLDKGSVRAAHPLGFFL